MGSSRWIWLNVVPFDWSLLKGEPQRFLANSESSLGTINSGNANLHYFYCDLSYEAHNKQE
jgi:hypothetical protein